MLGAAPLLGRRPAFRAARAGRPGAGRALPRAAGGAWRKMTGTARRVDQLKGELRKMAESVQRGVNASEEEKASIDDVARQLERLNPTPRSLESPLINGRWQLQYTTSASILQPSRPVWLRPQGPIFQTIDTRSLKALNEETWPFFNKVEASLTPTSKSCVNVQFKTFRIFGILPITAPPSARGTLDTTFLDEDMRISRGDKGNLFVLQQEDPSATL